MQEAQKNGSQSVQIPELLNRDECSRLLHVSLSYIDNCTPDLPRVRIGRKVLFNKNTVIQWLLEHEEKIGGSKCRSKTEQIKSTNQ